MDIALGRITVCNDNNFSQGNDGIQTSALFQEPAVHAGQLECYKRSHQVLDKFLCIQVSANGDNMDYKRYRPIGSGIIISGETRVSAPNGGAAKDEVAGAKAEHEGSTKTCST